MVLELCAPASQPTINPSLVRLKFSLFFFEIDNRGKIGQVCE